MSSSCNVLQHLAGIRVLISALINWSVCNLWQACIPRGSSQEVPDPRLQISLQRQNAGTDPQSQFSDNQAGSVLWTHLQQTLQHVPQLRWRWADQCTAWAVTSLARKTNVLLVYWCAENVTESCLSHPYLYSSSHYGKPRDSDEGRHRWRGN